jgi:radical SAM protein with 4Fe4S-binding SPASM domain
MLLYPYLRDILELMHECKFLPIILSTKSFLSKEKAAMIRDTKLTYVLQYSLDSTDDKVADYLVRRKGFCKWALESIDNAIAAGIPLATRTVITPYNLRTIPQLYRDLKKRGVPTIQFAMYIRSGYRHSDSLFISEDDYIWLNQQLQQLKEEFPKDNIYIQNSKPLPEARSGEDKIKADYTFTNRAQCPAGLYMMMICADGKVIPCEQMAETEEYFCGDLSHQSIQEVWNGSRLIEMTHGIPREKFKGSVCYDCEEREDCRNFKSVCVRNLAIYHRNIHLPDMNCPKSNLPFVRMT